MTHESRKMHFEGAAQLDFFDAWFIISLILINRLAMISYK